MENNSRMPLPPDLINLPTIEAEPWFKITPTTDATLEGPAFDKEGNLFVTMPARGIIYKITARKRQSLIFENKKFIVCGSAFHKNGRLFVVCISGDLLVINPDDNKVTYLNPQYNAKTLSMNDLVFNDKGNIYITDFKGTSMDPTGGVYRLSSNAKTVQPVLLHLASPNGISLSPDGSTLWVCESTRNAVIRIDLLEDGLTPNPKTGVTCVYYSTGCPGPDSNKVDVEGNLYQCIMGQGRLIVLNAHGIPVANVIVKGRNEGKYLRTANLAFKPGTSDGYITTSGEGGAFIFKFKGLAEGLLLFSHK